MKYEVLRNYTRIGEKEYMVGDTIDGDIDYPFDVAIRHGFLKVKSFGTVTNQTFVEKKPSTSKQATITRGGPWFKVLDENGELIGKATRDETEANEIKKEYEQA